MQDLRRHHSWHGAFAFCHVFIYRSGREQVMCCCAFYDLYLGGMDPYFYSPVAYYAIICT